MDKHNDYLSVSKDSNVVNTEPTFLKESKLNSDEKPSQQQVKAEKGAFILSMVSKHQPINCWDLEKLTLIPHTTLFTFLRNMEFVGLVYSKKSYKTENKVIRMYYTSKEYKLKEVSEDEDVA